MKGLDPAFESHIESGATTLCWCWRIVRSDGVVLGFTDHDRAISLAGQTYDPASGLDGAEAPARLGPQVQTTEVLGVLTSEAIAESDIVLGRYDGARVESWRVNWAAPDQRVHMRTDTIGEITRADGVFRAELRSGQHALNVTVGRIYQHLCDARLGDGRCGVDLDVSRFRHETVVSDVVDAHSVEISGLADFAEGWFAFGHAEWGGGDRDGLRDGITAHAGAILTFAEPVGDWVAVGDALTLFAGCDKRFGTCRDKFANGVNFQGFPHIPGNDAVMAYPTPEDALDGAPLVR